MTLNFALIHAAPGDPVTILAGDGGTPAYYAELRARFGLDDPLAVQYLRYMGNVLRGDFGASLTHGGRPVLSVIGDRMPATLMLALTANVLATLLGVLAGVELARRRAGAVGGALRALLALGYAAPVFVVGQVALWLFAYRFDLFPVGGMRQVREPPEGFAAVRDIAHHLVLPVLCLALSEFALIARLTASGVRDALAEDFTRTARAKGLPGHVVVYRHAMRNAVLPVVTVLGGHLATLLAGATLIEIVYAWPGLGRLLYDATLARDYPLILAMFWLIAAGTVIINLLTDLAYSFLDPRVRYG